MPTFKIWEIEHKSTATGQKLATLVLNDPTKQYPYRNVTVWEDFPGFATLVAGGEVEGQLKEEESENINPKSGKPYINRTLVAMSAFVSPKTAPQGNLGNEIRSIHTKLDKILAKLDTDTVKKELEEEINVDDIPF